tara:strand:- start:337 stop:882 length:546 start_codon:yes stop_codon:yes gene_type:complete
VKQEGGTPMAKPPLPTAAGKRRRSNSSSSSSGSHEEHAKLPISAATTGEQGSFTPIVGGGGIAAGTKRGRERERDTKRTRARITFRSASPNSINIASALSLLAGVRGSPIVMEKVGGVDTTSSESDINSGSPSDSFARKDSIDDSTTSSDTSTTHDGVGVEVVHGNEKAPWLEIVGVAVTK